MPLAGVIYDLDGTLVDSKDDLADSVNAMLARLSLDQLPAKTIHSFIGEGAERLIRRSLGADEHRYAEAAPIWLEEYEKRLLVRTRLYPGISDVVREPPDARAVLTNKPGRFAREILRGLGILDAFRAVVGGDEAPRKPSADGLLGICRQLSIAPADTLLVGDSAVDLATGKAAGVRVCGVTWGLGGRASLAAADYLCGAPSELRALIGRLRT